MTQPITIRADTPREAVEEVCKWLEERVTDLDPHIDKANLAGDRLQSEHLVGRHIAFEVAARAIRSATIEPKEPTNG